MPHLWGTLPHRWGQDVPHLWGAGISLVKDLDPDPFWTLAMMEAPRSLIDAMVATGSSEIYWADAEESLVPAERQLRNPPSWREWVDASCGSFTAEEAAVAGWLAHDFLDLKATNRPGKIFGDVSERQV